jgi:branched-chain amino acid aminotransferase
MLTETISIRIQKTSESRLAAFDFNNLAFGKNYSDHMFIAEYGNGHWESAEIVPYGNLQFTPAMSSLHYGQAIFEGFKAYRDNNGQINIFRPRDNWKRLNISSGRMAMPEIPEELFMEGLTQLVSLDKEWVPSLPSTSLYIRPVMFGTEEYIGLKPSDSYMLSIITGPVEKVYHDPLKVLVETEYTRAEAGGTGFVKAAGNYGRSLLPTRYALEKGYHQLIWTDAKHHRYIEESGTMNVMFVIDDILITPPSGITILNGITRDSVLTLAQDIGIKTEVRRITVDEITEASDKGILKEAFGVGTAATIAPIKIIGYNGKDYKLPSLSDKHFSKRIALEMDKIQRGISEDKHKWMYPV